jgi:hypothetical protein
MGTVLDKLTNGKDTIKVFNNSALGAEKDTIEQTKIGAIAMTRVNIAPMNNICPTTVVPTMPFLFRSKEHMRAVLDGPIGEEILKSCEAQGFIGLAVLRQRLALDVHRQEADQDAGRREGLEGARAAERPVGRAARGDGRERDADAVRRGLHRAEDRPRRRRREQLPVVRELAPLRGREVLFEDRALDGARGAAVLEEGLGRPRADQQKALRQAAKESVPYMRKLWDEREEKSLATVKAGGAQIIEVDKPAFQAAMKPVYDKFITDPKLKDLIKRIQDTRT